MSQPQTKTRPPHTGPLSEPPSLYIYPDVLEEIRFNGAWRADRLATGLLLGGAYLDPETGAFYSEVEGFLGGSHIENSSDLLPLLRNRWAALQESISKSDAQLLGWYLAHPKEAPAQTELLLHNTFFTQSWQRGLWIPLEEPPLALSIEDGVLHSAAVAQIESRPH